MEDRARDRLGYLLLALVSTGFQVFFCFPFLRFLVVPVIRVAIMSIDIWILNMKVAIRLGKRVARSPVWSSTAWTVRLTLLLSLRESSTSGVRKSSRKPLLD